ncbi:SP_1767 family glycosyltransferase [Chryseobacterium aquaticum]|uniref:Glycosyltransferase GT-D fold domain-containing protein n=2 Tax=Chryseobacterium aquaticum TaxID=452084 RepID=A0A101CLK0_9FLAO|nr:SP_1767 family glycosyltransferase [Chryseobacterium aquaticum]KQK27499.1 hypothetical protein AR438_00150 [Chryseobacterium aquaticum]KUJ58254.1 hypothetical protein AR686_00135 [Chryseobacterium aquaticum subsp. greenlandense]
MIKKISRYFNHYYSILKYPFCKFFYAFPKVQSVEETLQYIIDNKMSIARFGDGELSMLYHNNIGFQKYNADLKNRLKEIILDYKNDKCLVAIPSSLQSLDGFTLNARLMFKSLIGGYYDTYRKFLNFDHVYPNSFITRFYMDSADKKSAGMYFSMLKQIWNKREVIILEGEFTRFGTGNDLLHNTINVSRIIVPSKNAFDKYDSIIEAVQLNINKNSLILAAIGPTATVLCYDLSQMGFQAIDIGHADIEYEWFLKNRLHKSAVEGKFVNEVNTNNPNNVVQDVLYENQIIKKIL